MGMPGAFAEVRPGYARNYLIPQRIARLLDSKERKTWRSQQGVRTQNSILNFNIKVVYIL
jgi:ribosomal protein L9